jgi:hypothetical protein
MVRRFFFAVATLALIGAFPVPAQAGTPIVVQADLKIAEHKSGPFLVDDLYVQAPSQYSEQRVKKTGTPEHKIKFFLELQHDTEGVGTSTFEIHADADYGPGRVESKATGYSGWEIDAGKRLLGDDGVPVQVDAGDTVALLLAVKIRAVSGPGRVDWIIQAFQPMGPLLDTVVARTKVV